MPEFAFPSTEDNILKIDNVIICSKILTPRDLSQMSH